MSRYLQKALYFFSSVNKRKPFTNMKSNPPSSLSGTIGFYIVQRLIFDTHHVIIIITKLYLKSNFQHSTINCIKHGYRIFPRKTQTDSDGAYTFRACINKSAREFRKEKSCIFYLYVATIFKIVLYAN